MKKSTVIILVVAIVLAIYGVTIYNTLATASQEVESAWANVETQYQRRSDLIPNLVNTVKGYAAHESQTLEGVVAAFPHTLPTEVAVYVYNPFNALYIHCKGAGF